MNVFDGLKVYGNTNNGEDENDGIKNRFIKLLDGYERYLQGREYAKDNIHIFPFCFFKRYNYKFPVSKPWVGVLNNKNDLVIKPEWEVAYENNTDNNKIIVLGKRDRETNKYYYKVFGNTGNCLCDNAKCWDYINSYKIVINGSFIVDYKGEVIVPEGRYDGIEGFHYGYSVVARGDVYMDGGLITRGEDIKWNIIDSNGYECLQEWSSKRIKFYDDNNRKCFDVAEEKDFCTIEYLNTDCLRYVDGEAYPSPNEVSEYISDRNYRDESKSYRELLREAATYADDAFESGW